MHEFSRRSSRALGSRFRISQAGDSLTNHHVLAGAEAIEMNLFGDEAPINPGNSGGPFINVRGEVVRRD